MMKIEDLPEMPEELKDDWLNENWYKTANPDFYQDRIEMYNLFQKEICVPKSVIYPCCATDISPKKAFSNSEVALLEKDWKCIEVLKRAGIKAIKADVKKYKTKKKYDLLIILNPTVSSEYLVPFVDKEGYILSNNYHRNAKQILENFREFEPLGMIIKENRNKKPKIVKSLYYMKRSCDFLNIFKKK